MLKTLIPAFDSSVFKICVMFFFFFNFRCLSKFVPPYLAFVCELYASSVKHKYHALEQGWWTCGARPKMARGKIFLAHGIHCSPIFFILPDQRLYIVKNICVYTHQTALRLYMNCRCYQITLRLEHYYTDRVLNGYLSSVCQPGGD
jgi:hypothetical protein